MGKVTWTHEPAIKHTSGLRLHGVVKIQGPWTQSMKEVHGSGRHSDGPVPWTCSMEGVHVLYSPIGKHRQDRGVLESTAFQLEIGDQT